MTTQPAAPVYGPICPACGFFADVPFPICPGGPHVVIDVTDSTGVCAVCATTRPRGRLRPFVRADWTDDPYLLECLDSATCRATVLARRDAR